VEPQNESQNHSKSRHSNTKLIQIRNAKTQNKKFWVDFCFDTSLIKSCIGSKTLELVGLVMCTVIDRSACITVHCKPSTNSKILYPVYDSSTVYVSQYMIQSQCMYQNTWYIIYQFEGYKPSIWFYHSTCMIDGIIEKPGSTNWVFIRVSLRCPLLSFDVYPCFRLRPLSSISLPLSPTPIQILQTLKLLTECMTVYSRNSTNFKILDLIHAFMTLHGSEYMTADSTNSTNYTGFEGVHD
jgi:hypothetical protein